MRGSVAKRLRGLHLALAAKVGQVPTRGSYRRLKRALKRRELHRVIQKPSPPEARSTSAPAASTGD